MRKGIPLLALCSLALPAQAQTKVALGAFGAKVVGFRFFPSDEGFPPVAERFFRTSFDSATVKYVNMELELKYPATTGTLDFSLTCRYDGPAGYSATPALNGKVQSGWSGSYHVGGWGAKTRNTWAVGTYNVACREGNTVVASGSFEITRATYDIPSIKAVVTGLRMFEGPRDTPELKTRKYDNTFKSRDTRRLYIELGFDYPILGGAASFPIECRYEFPDGRSFAVNLTASLQQGWTGSYHVSNLGWDDAGKWGVGQYTTNCRFEGRLIAKGGFKIE